MDQFTIDETESFTTSLEDLKKELPQIGTAIEYAKSLIQSKPYESGFVIGKDGWRYFTTETSPRVIVYFYVDETKKAIWLMKIQALEETE